VEWNWQPRFTSSAQTSSATFLRNTTWHLATDTDGHRTLTFSNRVSGVYYLTPIQGTNTYVHLLFQRSVIRRIMRSVCSFLRRRGGVLFLSLISCIKLVFLFIIIWCTEKQNWKFAEGSSLPKLQDHRIVPNPATVVHKVPIDNFFLFTNMSGLTGKPYPLNCLFRRLRKR